MPFQRTGPGRIGIVTAQGLLPVVPSLVSLIHLLAEHGYGIDLYAWPGQEADPPLAPLANVRLLPLPQIGPQGRAAWRLKFFTHWLPHLVRQVGRARPACLLGVDHVGLMLATVPARLYRLPLVYLSLEVYCRDELTSPYLKILKWGEKRCNRFASFTLIQDEDRAALLLAENRIPPEQIVYWPNALVGEGKPARTDIIRETLGLEKSRTVVLYVGSISQWNLTLELARAARTWPEHLAMVFHVPGHLNTAYQRAFLQEIDARRTYLIQSQMDLYQLRDFVGAADLGIALHAASPHHKNVYTMGRASGKIALYLQCGLPLITTDLPSVRKYVAGYRCGICVNREAEVPGAISAILADYGEYAANALTCFQEQFAVRRFAAPLLQRFDQIMT